MSNEIAFKSDVSMEAATRADFTYKITPNTELVLLPEVEIPDPKKSEKYCLPRGAFTICFNPT